MKAKFNLFLVAAALQTSVFGAPLYKANNSDNLNLVTSWSTISGLVENPAAIGSTDALYFNEVNMLGDKTLALGGNLEVGGLAVDYATTDAANNVTISAGNTLTLNGTTLGNSGVPASSYTGAGIVLNRALGGTLTINSDIVLGAAQQWVSGRTTGGFTIAGAVNLNNFALNTNVAVGTSTISGAISGSSKFTKSGGGTLALPNANPLTGIFQLGPDAGAANSGVVLVGNATSMGSGSLVSRGTQLRSSVADLTITNPIAVGAGGLRLGGTNDFTLSGITTLDGSGRSVVNYGTNTVTLGGIATVASSVANFDIQAGRIVVSGPITGPGGINVSTGIITLNGTNTYSGTTLVSGGRISGTGTIPTLVSMSGGTIRLAGGATTGGALTFGAGATFTGTPAVTFDTTPVASTTYDVFNYTGTVTTLENLTSAARGSFANTGTKVTFTTGLANQARTWNGTTGTWDGAGVNANWLGGDLKFYNGDSASFPEPAAAATVTVSGTVTATGFAISNTTNAYTITGGAITGTTGVVKSGTGTATLASAANSFTGNVTIIGGTLVGSTSTGGTNSTLGLNSSSRSITVNTGGTLSMATNNILGNNAQTLATTTKLVVNGGTATTANFNVVGDIDLNGGLLTATGGASDGYQSYEFNGSTINVGGAAASTMSATGVNSGMHIAGGKTLTLNVADVASGADLTISAPLRNGSNDRGGIGSVVKSGAGSLVLSGSNVYTGATTISGGAVSVTGAAGLVGPISLAATTSLNVSGAGSLGAAGSYAGAITNSGVLTFSSSAAQTVTGVISGAGSLVKSGTGNLTLDATQTYTGATSVTGGKLTVAGALDAASAVTVSGSGVLTGNGSVNGAVTVNPGAAISVGNAAAGEISLGSLTFPTTGTINVAEIDKYGGFKTPIFLANNLVANGGAGSITVNLPPVILAAGIYNLVEVDGTINATASQFALGTAPLLGSRQSGAIKIDSGFVVYEVSGINPIWTGAGNGQWTTAVQSPKNWKTNVVTDFINGDGVTFNDTATGTTTVTLAGTVVPSSVLFDNSTAKDYSITGAGTISGAGLLTKSGNGTLTIGTANGYSGGTLINGGVLDLQSGASLGSGAVALAGARLNLADPTFGNAIVTTGGTLGGSSLQLNGVISGTSLNLDALGIVKLNAVNTYTGATTVVSGGLELIGSSQLGAGDYPGAIANPVLLRFSTTADQILRGAMTGAGQLVKNNNNTLTLTGAQNYTGTTTVNGGTLALATPENTKVATDQINVNSNATLRIDSTNILYSGTNFVPLVVTGGTITLNANHNHFGPLSLQNGATIRGIRTADSFANEYSTFDADVTVGGNARSEIAGNDVARGYNLNNASRNFIVNPTGDASGVDLLVSGRFTGGAVGLLKSGDGVMRLTAANAYSGTTTISGGTLDLSTTGQIYAGNYRNTTVTINTGGTLKINQFNYSETVGTTSSLGALRDYGDARLINGGTLEVLGVAHSAGNNFHIGTNGGTFRYAPTVTTDTLTLEGNGNSNIALAGALTLDAVGKVIIAEIIDGAGSLVKTGGQTLTLTGANAYAGATTVSAGILAVTGNSLPNGTSLTVGAGVVDLTGNETVGTLFFGATQKAAGIWGAPGSGAPNTDARFSGTGTLIVTNGPAVVSGYGTWADVNAPGQGAGGDFDNDGVSNGAEYVLGGLASTQDSGKLPTISASGANLVFSFKRDQDSKTVDTTVAIEVGTTLASWTDSYSVGNDTAGSTTGVTVTDNGDGFDTVTLTIPKGSDTKKFARLSVIVN